MSKQNCGSGVKRSKNNSFPYATRTLHAEDLNMGNLLFLSKKTPTPRFRVNPYIDVDFNTGKIILTKKKKKTLNILEEMLSGKVSEKQIDPSLINSSSV